MAVFSANEIRTFLKRNEPGGGAFKGNPHHKKILKGKTKLTCRNGFIFLQVYIV